MSTRRISTLTAVICRPSLHMRSLYKPEPHGFRTSLPRCWLWEHGQRHCALISQRGLCLGAGRVDARHADTALDVVAYYDWWAAAWRGDVEVLEFDILADSIGVGAAGQRCDSTTILARRVTREVLKQNIGNVDLRRISCAGSCVDL